MGGGYHGNFGKTCGAGESNTDQVSNRLDKNSELLVEELRRRGVKFYESDIVFIVRDPNGKIVWLEQGTESAGFQHILYGESDRSGKQDGHLEHFNRIGVGKDEIPAFLRRLVSRHSPVYEKPGQFRLYKIDKEHYVIMVIGSNGFIVSAYPTTEDKVAKWLK